jgi:ferritin-like protein
VRSDLKTPEVCLAAVKNYKGTIKYIPSEKQTLEICKMVVEDKYHAKFICPKKFEEYFPKNYVKLVETDKCKFCGVPEKFQTQEVCLAAVKQNGVSIEYVPEKIITKKLCLVAAKQNGYAIRYIPSKFQTEEICLAANKTQMLVNMLH